MHLHAKAERLVNDISARIDRAEFLPGARLPPVRELAEHYHVAQSTVARAVSELVKRGALVGRFGVGFSVAEEPAADDGPETA